MKPLGPTRDSISLLYESQPSDLAATSLVSSGLSPTSARRDDSTSSKLLLLSNLRRTPVRGISLGVESFMVVRLHSLILNGGVGLRSEVISKYRQAPLRFSFGCLVL